MNEIELKILNIDPDKIHQSLVKVGAILIHDFIRYREIYFENSLRDDVPFSSLRLRAEGDKAFLTMKFKKGQESAFLVREELQIEVSDFRSTLQMLEAMGFNPFRKREKDRKEYLLDDIKIELDQYPEIPPYLEVEGSSQESLTNFLRKIGLDLALTNNLTATAVIKKYGKNPDRLLFNDSRG